MKECDVLVVGLGVSGVNVSWSLINEGKKVFVISSNEIPSSSLAAAGTWNPLNFKKLVPAWNASLFLKKMYLEYGLMEQRLDCDFLQVISSKKILANQNEINFWLKQSDNFDNKDFLSPEISTFQDFKLGSILNSGRVNIPVLLDNYINYLNQSNLLIKENFQYGKLKFVNGYWEYNNIKAKHVVFCEGVNIVENPFFNWVKLKPVKGDVIKIHAPGLNINYILKKGIFILPEEENHYLVGATYHWHILDNIPSEEAKKELLDKLRRIIDIPFEVVGHQSGVRPASLDRRPIIGEHPDKKGLWIFNGMGAKGVFLAPQCANWLFNNMYKSELLPEEVAVNRLFKKHYFN